MMRHCETCCWWDETTASWDPRGVLRLCTRASRQGEHTRAGRLTRRTEGCTYHETATERTKDA